MVTELYSDRIARCRPDEVVEKYGEETLHLVRNADPSRLAGFPDDADADDDRYLWLEAKLPAIVYGHPEGDLDAFVEAPWYQENGHTGRLRSYDTDTGRLIDATISTCSVAPADNGQIVRSGDAFTSTAEFRGVNGVEFGISSAVDMFEREGPSRDGDRIEFYNQIQAIDHVLELGRKRGIEPEIVFDERVDDPCDPPYSYLKTAVLDIMHASDYIHFEPPTDREGMIQRAEKRNLAVITYDLPTYRQARRRGVPAETSDRVAAAFGRVLDDEAWGVLEP